MHQGSSQPFLPRYSVAADQIALLGLLLEMCVIDKQTVAGSRGFYSRWQTERANDMQMLYWLCGQAAVIWAPV